VPGERGCGGTFLLYRLPLLRRRLLQCDGAATHLTHGDDDRKSCGEGLSEEAWSKAGWQLGEGWERARKGSLLSKAVQDRPRTGVRFARGSVAGPCIVRFGDTGCPVSRRRNVPGLPWEHQAHSNRLVRGK